MNFAPTPNCPLRRAQAEHAPGVRPPSRLRSRSPRARFTAALWFSLALAALTPAHASIPVIDIGAITQMLTQIQILQDQLTTAQNQLTQAQSQLTAMTGTRGMQQLLSNTPRNYLPADYRQLVGVMDGAAATYSALASEVQSILKANAVLTPSDLARFTPAQRALLEEGRRESATLDALTRSALSHTSGRFAALQSLIQTIGAAQDEKAILDLQARIGAEQGMLQNEATKLDVLYRSADAQRQRRAQQVSEQAIAGIGSLKALPPLGLTVH